MDCYRYCKMNKNSEFAARVRHEIMFRAECNELIRLSKKSPFPADLYAYLRLLHHNNASILCIAMTSRGKYIDEVLLNKEHVFRAVRFIERMRDFCTETKCKKLYIAVNTEISDTVFPVEVYERTVEKVALDMKRSNISVRSEIFSPDTPFCSK